MAKHDILVVGNPTHDTLIHSDSNPPTETLGGSSSYISCVLNSLAIDFAVVAKAGHDFKYSSKMPHPPFLEASYPTTQFIADFRRGPRLLRVGATCAPIRPEDIQVQAKVAMACGVLNEILPETLLAMSDHSRSLICDIQSLIRVVQSDGALEHRALVDTPHATHISRIQYLKVSRDEAEFVDLGQLRTHSTILLTEGEGGCTVLERDREFHLGAPKAREVDPTGAGDCFLAGFACGLVAELPIEKCVELANRCGALAVTQVGVPDLTPYRHLLAPVSDYI